MTKVNFDKGTEANLPTTEMVEDGHIYVTTDNGNAYLGNNSALIPFNRCTYYGVCTTNGGIAVKVVSSLNDGAPFSLKAGVTIIVKFTNANSVSSPSLNVCSTGAVSIKEYGTTGIGNTASSSWRAGEAVLFLYDGTNWQRVSHLPDEVQSDWRQTNQHNASYIWNKPAIDTGEGINSIIESAASRAYGRYSHAEGNFTNAIGNYSHAEGDAVETVKTDAAFSGKNGSYSTLNEEAHGLSVGQVVCFNDKSGSSFALITEVPSTSSIVTSPSLGSLSGVPLLVMHSYAGVSAHAEGSNTIAWGTASHAEGSQTSAYGVYSHTEGANTETKNSMEHAEGSYNVSNHSSDTWGDSGNTIHSIGIGTGNGLLPRKNAVEVMQNGDVYIKGIGSYDGTNPSSSVSLKDSLDGKVNKVSSTDNAIVRFDGSSGDIQNSSAYLDDNGNIIAHKFVKYGGTSSQFLKANGDVDSNAYITSASLPVAATSNPLMDGTEPVVGDSAKYARENHVHPSDTSRVPTTRKVNNKALSSDITLTASDVGALPSNTVIPTVGTLNTNITDAQPISSSESLSETVKLHKISKTGNYDDLIDAPAIKKGTGTSAIIEGRVTSGAGLNVASGTYSHAEGYSTTASGYVSHAEGESTTSSNSFSHAEGASTTASGNTSHAEGGSTTASGAFSHAEGCFTTASNDYEHAEGHNNVSHTGSTLADKTRHSIGIGSGDVNVNALEIMANGDMYIYGLGTYDGADYSSATKLQDIIDDIETAIGTIPTVPTLTGGNGISVSGNASSKTIAVDLASSPGGLGFTNDHKLVLNAASSSSAGYMSSTDYNKINFQLIPNNSDLNDYTTEGCYYVGGGSAGSTAQESLSHTPYGSYGGFSLFVLRNGINDSSSLYRLQIYSQNNGCMWQRNLVTIVSGSTTTQYWRDWAPITPIKINSGADLNNFTMTGIYVCSNDTVASGTSNIPSGLNKSFKLEVISNSTADLSAHPVSPTQVYQRLTTREASGFKRYDRNYSDSTWGSWNQWYVSLADAQSDWEQGSDTAPDHVKNRPNIRIGVNGSTKVSTAIVEGNLSNIASGTYSHAEGSVTRALSSSAHAEGQSTTASGDSSHAEGYDTEAIGMQSHAENRSTKAIGNYSHAEGSFTVVCGLYSHSEGTGTSTAQSGFTVTNKNGDSTGNVYTTSAAHGLSVGDVVSYDGTHVGIASVGSDTEFTTTATLGTLSAATISKVLGVSFNRGSHSEGRENIAYGQYSHAEGYLTKNVGDGTHSEGYGTLAYAAYSHSEGYQTASRGVYSHAEGQNTTSVGSRSHSEGQTTTSAGGYSHAEGRGDSTTSAFTVTGPDTGTTATYTTSAAHGLEVGQCIMYNDKYTYVTAVPSTTKLTFYDGSLGTLNGVNVNILTGVAVGSDSHAEGYKGVASGQAAHTEGYQNISVGNSAHAEGRDSRALNSYAHAEGYNTIALNTSEHAEGASNVSHTGSSLAEKTTHSIGIGTTSVRENAVEVMQNGDVYINGIGGYQGKSISGKKTLQTVIGEIDDAATTEVDWNQDDPDDYGYVFNRPNLRKGDVVTGGSGNAITEGDIGHNVASGDYSHAEGQNTTASGENTHAEGNGTKAMNISAHAEGTGTTANGSHSHAEGYGTSTIVSGVTGPVSGQANYTYNTTSAHGLAVYDVVSTNQGHTIVTAVGSTTSFTTAASLGTLSSGTVTKKTGYAHSYAHAEGRESVAWGGTSHSEGYRSKATGSYSHAEGYMTSAIGGQTHNAANSTFGSSHAEGAMSKAIGDASHAEGYNTTASGYTSHAEGYETTAEGIYGAHSEGLRSSASGSYSHAEGQWTWALGSGSHTESYFTSALDYRGHAEGAGSRYVSSGTKPDWANAWPSSVSWNQYTASGSGPSYTTTAAHNLVVGDVVMWELNGTKKFYPVTAVTSTTFTIPTANSYDTLPSGTVVTKIRGAALGHQSHSEGDNCNAIGKSSHAEGSNARSMGVASHAEGYNTVASSDYSHAEGRGTTATGANGAHAEGYNTTASGSAAHTEGYGCVASATYSHAEGGATQATNTYEHAEGRYNASHKASTSWGNAGNTIHSIGIGTANSATARVNAVEVMQNGDVYVNGVGGYDGKNPNTAGISPLQTLIGGLATDATVVHKTGSETIVGSKEFQSTVEIFDTYLIFTSQSQLKHPVDISLSNYYDDGGDGVAVLELDDSNGDGNVIVRSVYTPVQDYDAVNKKYVDDIVGDIETLLAAI